MAIKSDGRATGLRASCKTPLGALRLSHRLSRERGDGVEEARRWGAVMIFGDANLKSSFA